MSPISVLTLTFLTLAPDSSCMSRFSSFTLAAPDFLCVLFGISSLCLLQFPLAEIELPAHSCSRHKALRKLSRCCSSSRCSRSKNWSCCSRWIWASFNPPSLSTSSVCFFSSSRSDLLWSHLQALVSSLFLLPQLNPLFKLQSHLSTTSFQFPTPQALENAVFITQIMGASPFSTVANSHL